MVEVKFDRRWNLFVDGENWETWGIRNKKIKKQLFNEIVKTFNKHLEEKILKKFRKFDLKPIPKKTTIKEWVSNKYAVEEDDVFDDLHLYEFTHLGVNAIIILKNTNEELIFDYTQEHLFYFYKKAMFYKSEDLIWEFYEFPYFDLKYLGFNEQTLSEWTKSFNVCGWEKIHQQTRKRFLRLTNEFLGYLYKFKKINEIIRGK